jgi:hypothetical protein
MTRRIVVAGARRGVWAGVKITPGYGTAEERDATLDVLIAPWRKRYEAREAAARGAAS